MYLLRSKKNSDTTTDGKEFKDKRSSYRKRKHEILKSITNRSNSDPVAVNIQDVATLQLHHHLDQQQQIMVEPSPACDVPDGCTMSRTVTTDEMGDTSFHPDELPDGFCLSPQRRLIPGSGQDSGSIREAEYIGSFPVVGEDQTDRAEFVRKQLTEMTSVTKSKSVLLVISLSGIKVCSSDGMSVYMAHALKRISYATCDPEVRQFSFLAREPKGHPGNQFCHAFIAKSPDEAEALNTMMGDAFKAAYTQHRQTLQPQPTFNQLIEQQITEQKTKYQAYNTEKQKALEQTLSQISTATIADRVKERKEKRQQEIQQQEQERHLERLQGKDRVSWAKHVAGRAKHKSYIDEGGNDSSPPSPMNRNSMCAAQEVTPPSPKPSLLERFGSQSSVRSYGSPVTMLKDTIDNHFNDHGNLDSIYRTVESNGQAANGVATQNGTASQSASPRQLNMLSRPLPATPTKDKKGQKKGHHKSSPLAQRSTQEPIVEDSNRLSQVNNGQGHEGQESSRPVSMQYLNDSGPPHDLSDSDPSSTSDPGDPGDLYAGPPTPLRFDSLKKVDKEVCEEKDEELKNASWYQAGLPREIALEILQQQDVGSFIVRDSSSHTGCYALSVRVPKYDNPTGISHYLILRTSRGGVKLKGLDKEWPSLTALVTHHTVMPEMLPCPLKLPRTARNPSFRDTDRDDHRDDKEEDEDYSKLSDCTSMMEDLNM